MTLVKSLLLVTATLALAGVARADEDYYARYSALAPGDSTQTYGALASALHSTHGLLLAAILSLYARKP